MRRSFNILHIIANLHSGGVQHLLAKSLARMDRDAFRHHVCCISAGGVYQAEIEALGIPVTILNRRGRFAPDIVRQMASLMRRQKIDVVHSLNFTANAWGRLAAVLARRPRIIAHERGAAWTDTRVKRFINRALDPFTDLMLANSEAARILLRDHVGLSVGRIKVVYNGVPSSRVQEAPINLRQAFCIASDAPLIGAIGRLDTPKGCPFLFQALPYIWHDIPTVHAVIIGAGLLAAALQRLAADTGVTQTGRLHFMGYMPDAAAILPQMDVLLHPAIREPFGNVPVEAGFAETPVVASSVDGVAEVIVHGETGLLVDCTEPVEFIPASGASPLPEVVVDGRTRILRPPPGPNPQIFADHVIALLRDPALRRRLAEQAKERVSRFFTLERFVRDLEGGERGTGKQCLTYRAPCLWKGTKHYEKREKHAKSITVDRGIYHVMSRTALDGNPFGDAEKDMPVRIMKRFRFLYFTEVLGFCVIRKRQLNGLSGLDGVYSLKRLSEIVMMPV